jgi:hypothetical protein
MNWTQLITNILGTAAAGAAAGYVAGGWRGAALGAIAALTGNQVGLHQTPPGR